MHHIEPAQVRSVLQHLARDRAPQRTPLASLELVRGRLAAAGFQATPEACIYELGQVMTEVVERELRQLRGRIFDKSAAPDSLSDKARVMADFRCGDQDLECWSAVYYVYLRPDLRLDLRSLERLLADRHRRTIQRRLKSGTERLTVRLQSLEREARRDSRRRRLLTGIPQGPSEGPTGIDSLVDRVLEALRQGNASSPVSLGGPPGIGKTTVALAALRRACGKQTYPEAVWLTAKEAAACASTPDGLLAEIASRCELLAPLAPTSTPPGGCRIVAVDGVNDVPTAIRLTVAARNLPPSFRVLLNGRVCWSAIAGVRCIDVPPLDDRSALRLLRRELERRGMHEPSNAPDVDLLPVVKAAAGIPLLIEAAAGELRLASASSVGRAMSQGAGVFAGLAEETWSGQWWSVSEPAREASELVMVAERPDYAPGFGELSESWPRDRADLENGLREALDAGLLHSAGPLQLRRYRSSPLLASYVLRLAGEAQLRTSARADATSTGARG